ncbi:MAG: TPR end-of-group domain-containing protein [Opitutaceae bacterium]
MPVLKKKPARSPLATDVRVRFIEGYLALGLLRHAAAELRAVATKDRKLPAVLAARAEVHLEAKEWQRLVTTGRELAKRPPGTPQGWIHWAYALRELGRIEQALAVLQEAEPLHPKVGVIQFNLACYHCLLGDLPAAKRRLERACRIKPDWKKNALEDPDLKGLWKRFSPDQIG